MELELLKLLPGGGGVVAVLIALYLSWKQQDKQNDAFSAITDKFTAQTAATQKTFQDQLTALTAQGYANQKQYQDQIKDLIDDYMELTRETIAAIKSVENTVRAVEQAVRQLEDLVRNITEKKP